jgi:DNA polymerase-4
VIAPDASSTFLQGLPVDALWGVGPVTARSCASGIEKLVDVRDGRSQVLRDAVGSLAEWLQELAQREDDRPVVSDYEVKSSGSENTFAHRPHRPQRSRKRSPRWPAAPRAGCLKRDLYAGP